MTPKSIRCAIGLFAAAGLSGAPAVAQAQSNVAAAGAGGQLVSFASQYDDSAWAAANLIDGSPDKGWSGQSAGAQAFVIAFRGGALAELEDVVVNPYSRESPDNWVREVEIQVSTTYPFRDFRKVGTLSLGPEGTDHVFSFDRPTPARYLKLVFLSNGGGGYMQAGEAKAMGRLVDGSTPAPAYDALHEGATIESFSSQYDEGDWAAANLIAPDAVDGQWAGKNAAAQEVVVALPEATTVTDVAVNNYAREDPSNWARTAEVLLSPESSYKGFVSAGTLEMPPRGELHTLTLERPTPARYVKVVFRRNGGGGYMEAGRIRIYQAEQAPGDGGGGGAQSIAAQLETTGRAVTQEIHFATDSAEILPASEPVLREIAEVLGAQPGLELIIEGHTDGVGTAEHNLDLSRRRADAVKRWLVDRLGIGEVRLTTVGYGLTKPVADNASEDGRARNRRVELVRRGQ